MARRCKMQAIYQLSHGLSKEPQATKASAAARPRLGQVSSLTFNHGIASRMPVATWKCKLKCLTAKGLQGLKLRAPQSCHLRLANQLSFFTGMIICGSIRYHTVACLGSKLHNLGFHIHYHFKTSQRRPSAQS